MKNQSLIIILIFALLMSILLACRPAATADPVNPLPYPIGTLPDQSNPHQTAENVYVENMQINLMESFPLQVSVTVSGNLPDGCTSIVSSTAIFDDKNTFDVHIFTERPEDLMCTQALVPFEEIIPLEVYWLPAGKYTVNVYQLSDTFEFQTDNVIPQ